ncbi:hypothetical protein LguiA_025301 [Lonicera macranthoides]
MCFERNGFTPYFPLSWESVSGICAYQTKERNDFRFPSTKIREPNEALEYSIDGINGIVNRQIFAFK